MILHPTKTVYQILRRHALETPQAVAIIDNNSTITYEQFLEKIEEIVTLFSSKGLTSKDLVGLYLEQPVLFLSVMFACLKLGIGYIPIDAAYPALYVDEILKDSQAKALIMRNPSQESEIVLQFTGYTSNSLPEPPAYIIYTSGTTGKPKGVMIAESNLLHLMEATKTICKAQSTDIIPLFHSLGFDFSIWEIFLALLNGATLLVVPKEIKRSAIDYAAFIFKHKVSILNITPSWLCTLQSSLLQEYTAQSLRHKSCELRLIISGGEALYPARIKPLLNAPFMQKIEFYNMYGITEGTIHCTFRKISLNDATSEDSPIGAPLKHIEILVKDDELCLTGKGVTQGYLNHPEIDAISFFEIEGKRYFHTGDIVQALPDGTWNYIGRKNKLIKIKGARVNLTNLQQTIMEFPHIQDVVVSTCEDEDQVTRLVAFIKCDFALVDQTTLRKWMNERLPEFMRPSQLILVKEFSLTINGKTDVTAMLQNSTFVEPASATETILQIWKSLLKIEKIDIDDNFFDLGGDSFLLIKLQYALQTRLKREIHLMDLVKAPNIKSLVEILDLH